MVELYYSNRSRTLTIIIAMAFLRRLSGKAPKAEVTTTSIDAAPEAIFREGSLEFTVARGGNSSLPSYQEASGAPVETTSPLGYFVGPVTVVFLNISAMIGTGVYSTREHTREVGMRCFCPADLFSQLLLSSRARAPLVWPCCIGRWAFSFHSAP